ncbi:MAG: hypothetical protein ABEJ95_05000 [Candidatus Nanohalobium sp.]
MENQIRIDSETKERLVFIKSLYRDALEESRRHQPYASKSILRFHDSVELYLKLIADKIGANSANSFKDYWAKIEGVRGSEISLSHKSSMSSLDEARGDLKHFGIKFERSNIHRFREDVKEFFEENTEPIFGIKFEEIDERMITENEEISDLIEKADEEIKAGNQAQALGYLSVAFNEIIDAFESTKKGMFGRNALRFGENLRRADVGNWEDATCPNNDAIEKIKHSVDEIQSMFKIMSLGIKPRKYVRFKSLEPPVTRTRDGEDYNVKQSNWEIEPSEGDVSFARDFVMETLMALEEHDYEVKYRGQKGIQDYT